MEEGSLEQEPGSGVRGLVNGTSVAVGTLEWLHRHGACEAAAAGSTAGAAAERAPAGSAPPWSIAQSGLEASSGQTRVYVSIGNSIAACIDLADELRPGAAATVAALHRMGVSTVLLSGAVASPGGVQRKVFRPLRLLMMPYELSLSVLRRGRQLLDP